MSHLQNETGEGRDAHAADGPAETGEARDGSNGGLGEQVGGKRQQIRGPALMGRGGQSNKGDGDAEIRGLGSEKDGKHGEGADQHGRFAGSIDAPAALEQSRREPAAGETPERGHVVDDDQRPSKLRQGQTMALVEKFRQPEHEEPPSGIGDELSKQDGPRLAVYDQPRPRDFRAGIGEASRRGPAIHDKPGKNPEGAQRAGEEKRGLPSIADGKPRDGEGREGGSDIRAGIEDAGGEGALAFREPFRDRFDGRRKVSRFAQAEKEPGEAESGDGANQGVAHGGEAPKAGGGGVAQAGSGAVNEAASEQKADGIGSLKGIHDIGVLNFAPANGAL